MKITICSSAAFYEHVNEIKKQLEKLGHTVLVPETAEKMEKFGDYNVEKVKTWYKDESALNEKQRLMRGHFEKVVEADAILVVNDEKHGIKGYIGPNVLMEMAVAFERGKKIFVLCPITKEVSVWEEVMGMGSIFLGGNLSKITA